MVTGDPRATGLRYNFWSKSTCRHDHLTVRSEGYVHFQKQRGTPWGPHYSWLLWDFAAPPRASGPRLHTSLMMQGGPCPNHLSPSCCCRWADTEGRWERERRGGGLHPADLLPRLAWKPALRRFLRTMSGKTSHLTRASWSWKGNTARHDYSLKIIRHERTQLFAFPWEVISLFTIKKRRSKKIPAYS